MHTSSKCALFLYEKIERPLCVKGAPDLVGWGIVITYHYGVVERSIIMSLRRSAATVAISIRTKGHFA